MYDFTSHHSSRKCKTTRVVPCVRVNMFKLFMLIVSDIDYTSVIHWPLYPYNPDCLFVIINLWFGLSFWRCTFHLDNYQIRATQCFVGSMSLGFITWLGLNADCQDKEIFGLHRNLNWQVGVDCNLFKLQQVDKWSCKLNSLWFGHSQDRLWAYTPTDVYLDALCEQYQEILGLDPRPTNHWIWPLQVRGVFLASASRMYNSICWLQP